MPFCACADPDRAEVEAAPAGTARTRASPPCRRRCVEGDVAEVEESCVADDDVQADGHDTKMMMVTHAPTSGNARITGTSVGRLDT